MNIMMFNGLLLFMLFMWTLADMEPETEPTEEIQEQDYENEIRVDIQARRKACRNLGGKCIKKNRDCPSNRPLKTPPGRPYCSKRRHCCYPDALTTEVPAIVTTNPDLTALTEVLFAEDTNNVFEKLIITGGGIKLISTSDPNIFAGSTYAALQDLQLRGGYEPSVNTPETITPDRAQKQNTFISAIMETKVMKITEKYLQEQGKINGNLGDVLKKLWFSLYSRAKNGKTLGSSGFEHVFRGEINAKGSEVIGFHNWVFTFNEQDYPTASPNLVYHKPLTSFLNLGVKGKIVDMKFTWLNKNKYKGGTSMFIGTSPELEMAVYTVCFLMVPGNCEVKMANEKFTIITAKFKVTEFVGVAYPVVTL